ncbi:MAG: phosphatase PAP2 family protein [Eubacteriales bacterium]|nr:phosphatase PAP2 family protein [Eubacteriales bacterium]MDD4513439.1 phosphatase PAP2 family protein [Eubacteriales bacterium]
MPAITHFGDGGVIWVLMGIIMTSSKRYRKNGVQLLFRLLCGLVIGNLFLKNLVARPRPCWLEPQALLLISMPKDYSFPSGHTLAAVIAALSLTQANGMFGCAAIPLAVLIAFSRMYLFVHFPSDILASAILGVTIVLSTKRAFCRMTTHGNVV